MRLDSIQKRAKGIQEKTGIDFSQYKDEAWAEQLSELLRFPQYAIKTAIQPPILLLVIVIVLSVICFQTGHGAFGTVFLLTGIVLSIPNGLLLAVIYFVFSLTSDVHRLLELSLGKARVIAEKVGELGDKQQRRARLAELIQGVIFSMVLPDLNRVVKKSVPLIGGLVAAVLGSLLSRMAKRLEKRLSRMPEPDVLEEALVPQEGKRLAALDKIEYGSERLTQGTARVVSAPFFVVWLLVAIVSSLIIYLEYQALY
ncbi:MAG: hypothetical protein AAF587_12490 [Bacteroidota bacterium]